MEEEAFINQWDEGIEEFRELEQKTNYCMEKTLFKELIQDVDYTPILSGLDIMETHAIIEQVKE